MNKPTLSPQHREFLDKHAISPDRFLESGGYTAQARRDLPPRINCPTPALCFPLRRLSGPVVWQARPDRPAIRRKANGSKRTLKYVAQWGESGVLADRSDGAWKSADTILICEGTKQSLVAAEYAPDDVAVIGILGCQNWTTGGVPAEDLRLLMAESRANRIIIAFDADIRVNAQVWRAARRLGSTLESLARDCRPMGGTPDVLFSTVQNEKGSSKADIDGVLGILADPERRREISRIVSEAGPLDPWGANLNTGLTVRPDWGLTLALDDDEPAPTDRPDVLPANTEMNAAVTIDTVWQWMDDGTGRSTPETTLDLAVDTFRPGDKPMHGVIRGVKWADTADLGTLLLKAPGQAGLIAAPPMERRRVDRIREAARRLSEGARLVRLTRRIGWMPDPENGDWAWVCPKGAIEANGWNTDLRSRVNGVLDQMDFAPDPADDGQRHDLAVDTVRLATLMRRLLSRPERADAMLGAWALAFLPIAARCSVAVFGEYAGGKSTLMQTYNSLLGPAWTPERNTSMFNFYATENAVTASMDGVDDCPLFYDDMKMPASKAERESLNRVFDAIVRRSHGGGAKMRGTWTDGRTQVAERDGSQPLAFIVGERIPTDAQSSALSRVFQLTLPDRGQMMASEKTLDGLRRSGGLEADLIDGFQRDCMRWTADDAERTDGSRILDGIYRMTGSDSWRRITPAWVRWLARRMNEGQNEDATPYTQRLEERRNWWRDRVRAHSAWLDGERRLAAQQMHLTSREAILVAGIMTGLEQFIEFARDLAGEWLADEPGLIEPLEDLRARLETDILGEMIETHLASALKAEPTGCTTANVKGAVESAVSQNRVMLDGVSEPREHDYRPVIGVRKKVRDRDGTLTECVCVDVKAIRANIRELGEYTDQDVTHALESLALPDRHGERRRRLILNGRQSWYIPIPMNQWIDPNAEDPDKEAGWTS